MSCDERAVCGVELRSPRGGVGRPIEGGQGSTDFGHELSSRGDGRFALVHYGADGGQGNVAFYAPDGRFEGSLDEAGAPYFGLPRWLPGDAGLVAPRDSGVVWIHQRDGQWISEEIPALAELSVDVVIVIEP